MPELPEVESVRQSLLPKICHKKIISIEVATPSILRNTESFFIDHLRGKEFIDIGRIGKLLLFELNTQEYMLAHLKMTGKFIYSDKKDQVAGGHSLTKPNNLDPKHTHIIFTFADNSTLIFHDVRKFGYLEVVDHGQKEKTLAKFGIEPLTPLFTLENFETILKKKKVCIKTVLLDQKSIAGIGNIYADEICFSAGILPTRIAQSLTKKERLNIFTASQDILARAIEKRGTTFHDYVDGDGKKGGYLEFLQVYQRTGQDCPRCLAKIVKIRVAGRGTHICKNCQI